MIKAFVELLLSQIVDPAAWKDIVQQLQRPKQFLLGPQRGQLHRTIMKFKLLRACVETAAKRSLFLFNIIFFFAKYDDN